jgi:beta-RFAP synthase
MTYPTLEIAVRAPARLHLGFLDLHGGLGRTFGSLGLTLEGPATRLRMRRAPRTTASGPEQARILRLARQILEGLQIEGGVAVAVEEAIPVHAGLGSGTQMALALAEGIRRLYHHPADLAALAAVGGRGRRSGIGIAAFRDGGFLVDGGRGAGTVVPPLLARQPFPADWRVLLVYDHGLQGLAGEREVAAFGALPPMSPEVCGILCRLCLLQLLPALAERDFTRFAQAVTQIQDTVGDHFAPSQEGRYASPRVARVLGWLAAAGVVGYGQSSWGPTGFAFVATEEEAEDLLADARAAFAADPEIEIVCSRGHNTGAEVASRESVAGDVAVLDPVAYQG